MFRAIVAVTAFSAVFLCPAFAQVPAEPTCFPEQGAIGALHEQGYSLSKAATDRDGRLAMLWVSSARFLIIVTTKDGQLCVVAHGDWQLKPKDDPT